MCSTRSRINVVPYNIVMRNDYTKVNKATFTPDSRPTPDQCRPIFMAWSGMIGLKITRSDWRAYLSPINARCIRAVSLMHPRSNPALPDLPQFFRLTNPRSARPTPTYSWYNYAHYAQYRTNPRSDFYSRPQMLGHGVCFTLTENGLILSKVFSVSHGLI